MALAYKERLERLEPNVKFLMTLYLSPDLTVEEVAKAKAAGIVGVKSYPKFVLSQLTNSQGRNDEF
jgi:dihydroorotase